jgi:hypothetical protein
MTDPVMAEDGHTYQRYAIERWIDQCAAGEQFEKKGSNGSGIIQHALLWWFGWRVYNADKRPVTSPLTGAPMGMGLKPNLIVRSLALNLVRSDT